MRSVPCRLGVRLLILCLRRYDHQMVVDSEGQRLFVFGGKLSQAPASDSIEGRYSGMYSCDIASRKWTYLLCVSFRLSSQRSLMVLRGQRRPNSWRPLSRRTPALPNRSLDALRPNSSHALHFRRPTRGQVPRRLVVQYVLASLPPTTSLTPTRAVKLSSPSSPSTSPAPWRSGSVLPSSSDPTLLQTTLLSADYSLDGPAPGFTQRATIDVGSGEWTVLTGMVKDEKSQDEVPAAEVWVHARGGGWRKVECRGEVPEGRFGGQVSARELGEEKELMVGRSFMIRCGASITCLGATRRIRRI